MEMNKKMENAKERAEMPFPFFAYVNVRKHRKYLFYLTFRGNEV